METTKEVENYTREALKIYGVLSSFIILSVFNSVSAASQMAAAHDVAVAYPNVAKLISLIMSPNILLIINLLVCRIRPGREDTRFIKGVYMLSLALMGVALMYYLSQMYQVGLQWSSIGAQRVT